MTREEAKKMLPIIKAWAEGREIEYADGGVWWVRLDDDDIKLGVPAEYYRVVPRYRPFKDNKECMKALQEHGPLIDRMAGAIRYPYVLQDIYFWVGDEKITYDEGFIRFIFKDGEPFGVKE